MRKISTKQPLASKAYDIILDKITTMELEPGQRLDEKQLVTQLGIGRTPIREAFLKLSSESLIENKPNKGFFVRPLKIQDIRAAYEALILFEFNAAALAINNDHAHSLASMETAQKEFIDAIETDDILKIVRGNHNFHMSFAECSSNIYVVRALVDVRNEVNRLSYLAYRGKTGFKGNLRDYYMHSSDEHEQIIQHFKNRDLDKLKSIIDKHIRDSQQRVIHYLTGSDLPFR